MHITELRMNYDRKNFFGVTEQVTEFTSWFRDEDHMKSLIRKALNYICKNEGYPCLHVTFEDGGKKYCYNICVDYNDYENGTVSVRVQDCFGAYSVSEWSHVSVATMRKRLYALCKFEDEFKEEVA